MFCFPLLVKYQLSVILQEWTLQIRMQAKLIKAVFGEVWDLNLIYNFEDDQGVWIQEFLKLRKKASEVFRQFFSTFMNDGNPPVPL